MASAPGFVFRPRKPRPRPADLTAADSAELTARAERLVGYMLKTLRRRGAIVGGVSVALRRSLVQSVAARLTWTAERWREQDRSEAKREDHEA